MTSELLDLFPSAEPMRPFDFYSEDMIAEDEAFRVVRPLVLERDGNACRYCGFQDKGIYMQVHHRDHDHGNNGIQNLVTACVHCHAVHHIGLWGNMNAMAVVWLPELTQVQVSALSRSLLVARHGAGLCLATGLYANMPFQQAYDAMSGLVRGADAVERVFAEREAEARRMLGTSDPAVLANCLQALPTSLYERRTELLAGFRFVIGRQLFAGGAGKDMGPEIVRSWLKPGGAFFETPPGKWDEMACLAA